MPENVGIVRGVRTKLPSRTERASQRRTLDERFFVRFPATYRLLAKTLMRLPPRSRFRRLMLARLGGRAAAAADRRDFDVLLYGFDPAIEFELPESLVGGYLPPDLLGVHHGHAGYRRMWEGMLEAWPDLQLEPEEIIDFGDRILAAGRATAHGRHSGIALDVPLFQVFTLRQGLVIRQKDFNDRDQALEAAGLSE
jgi:ketosteroid isomerase-like protein